ncbi:hypothetical protein A3Q56_08366, partial [Intoshia linei]
MCGHRIFSKKKKYPVDGKLKDTLESIYDIKYIKNIWTLGYICLSCANSVYKNYKRYEKPQSWTCPGSKNDCYFCKCRNISFNSKLKNKHLPNVASCSKPIPILKRRKNDVFITTSDSSFD